MSMPSGEHRSDVWVQQFILTFPDSGISEEDLLAWFASAIMSGYEWGQQVAVDGDG